MHRCGVAAISAPFTSDLNYLFTYLLVIEFKYNLYSVCPAVKTAALNTIMSIIRIIRQHTTTDAITNIKQKGLLLLTAQRAACDAT